MSTILEGKRRLKKTVGSVICLTLGVILGRQLGNFLGGVLFFLLAGFMSYENFCQTIHLFTHPNTTTNCHISQESIYKTFLIFKQLSSFLGMTIGGLKMMEVHKWYFYLRGVKTTHAYRFDKYRHYFFEIDNAYLDMIWAFLYVLFSFIVPLILGFFAGFFVYLMSSSLMGLFALLPGMIAFAFIFNWANETIWTLLHPHRMEAEINMAPDIGAMFDRREQEQNLLSNHDQEE